MRPKATLIILLAMSHSTWAQEQYWLNFDTVDYPLYIALDSVYPYDGWQIGAPQKQVFDESLSLPNALVTDTVLPYQDSGQWYAEFHIPVFYYGDEIFLEFMQRLSIDQGEASGWVEYFEPASGSWSRVNQDSVWATGHMIYLGEHASVTDSGVFYTDTSETWTFEQYMFTCEAVMVQHDDRGGGADTMRIRFAFHADSNTNGRDGWMIDDVHVTHYGPCTGIEEFGLPLIEAYPNPVDREFHLLPAPPGSESYRIEFINSTGDIVLRDAWRSSGMRIIDLSSLNNGPYLLRAISSTRQSSVRVVVQH